MLNNGKSAQYRRKRNSCRQTLNIVLHYFFFVAAKKVDHFSLQDYNFHLRYSFNTIYRFVAETHTNRKTMIFKRSNSNKNHKHHFLEAKKKKIAHATAMENGYKKSNKMANF